MKKVLAPVAAAVLLLGGLFPLLTTAQSAAAITLPYLYTFNSDGTVYQTASASNSTSPYWWVASGGQLTIANGVGTSQPTAANILRVLSRSGFEDVSAQVNITRVDDNLDTLANRHPYNGEFLIARYKDVNTYYYAGVRADGYAIIAKKVQGAYRTLALKKVFSGTYSSTNYDLIPLGRAMTLKFSVTDGTGSPKLSLDGDLQGTGVVSSILSVSDDATTFGTSISGAGLAGVQSDYAYVKMDNFRLDGGAVASTPTGTTPAPTPSPTPTPTPTPTTSGGYDQVILADAPVMYLPMNAAAAGTEADKTGNGHNGTYKGGTPALVAMPNGDKAADFNGSSQYITVPDSNDLSIATTKALTWEAWIRPDTLQFPVSSGGYVDFLGKCDQYSPTCEWEGRMYNKSNPENRPNRISGYVFNSSAGLGSAADWQPGVSLMAGEWLHVVVEYQMSQTPSGCNSAYPGSIAIWVNGVKWNMGSHMPTGCMSQFSISPKNSSSAFNIGTMALDTWFKGAIGKVAVYNRLLSQSEINEHFSAMTGASPSGSCAAVCTVPVPTQ